MNEPDITFIGAGNMARSLISGLLAAGVAADRLRASDPASDQRHAMAALGVTATADNAAAVHGAGVVVLAVKPQTLGDVLRELPLGGDELIVSIVAGVPIAALAAWAPPGAAIVRCMPNTPALLRAGITGLYGNARVSAAQRSQADRILGAAGKTLWVEDESLLDAVTAVSGSGPAYFFYLMEGMIDAGESLGLDREAATALTLETALGAARMALESGQAPAQLRANVTSPGGTTERALSILDAADVAGAVRRAVSGAAERARELAKEFGHS